MAELVCREVSSSYGESAVLRGVDLVVPEGGLTAILGASGSGKTTLLRLVMGLLRLQGGTISVAGAVVSDCTTHVAPEKRGVGYVSQEGALYPHLSVGQNVAFGLPRSERKSSSRIGEMLELVGLGPSYASRAVHGLSGGEQRRVALARALAPRPKLVLLDEPFSAVDASSRLDTRQAVAQALDQEGATAVLVTHDQAEALSMGQEVGVLRDGRLVQRAAPAVLYESPVDLGVARFVGEAVVLDGRFDGASVRCALGRLPVRNAGAPGPVVVVIRPELVQLHAVGALRQVPGGHPGVAGTVVAVRYLGSETMLEVLLRASDVVVTAKVFSHQAPALGSDVEVSVSGPVLVYPADQAGIPPLDAEHDGSSNERTRDEWPSAS